jgi:hypothetical protein
LSFRQYARSTKPGAGTFLAVAAYEGVSAPFCGALFASRDELSHRLDLGMFSGNCHVDDARNRLVHEFLKTDCEQLVFLDTDVMWFPGELRKLVEHVEDIVAGIYPRRADDQPWPVKEECDGHARIPNERGLVEVIGVPTGFLKIRRGVLRVLAQQALKYEIPETGEIVPCIFERTIDGTSRIGGDYNFCKKARALGYRIWVDPTLELGHLGSKLWQGSIGAAWRRHAAIPEGIKAIRAGKDTVETYRDMWLAWENPYALSPEATWAAVALAREHNGRGPVLELGCGLSTLCIAAATQQEVFSLEHMPMWASRVASLVTAHKLPARVMLCGRTSGWYDVDFGPNFQPALVISDGMEPRGELFTRMAGNISQAAILIDDVERPQTRADAEAYCQKHKRTLHVLTQGPKSCGLIV